MHIFNTHFEIVVVIQYQHKHVCFENSHGEGGGWYTPASTPQRLCKNVYLKRALKNK